MKTVVTILGSESKESKKLKPIEFVKVFERSKSAFRTYEVKPREWQNIILLKKQYVDGFDLMYCWDGCGEQFHSLVLGHFNDGVVE